MGTGRALTIDHVTRRIAGVSAAAVGVLALVIIVLQLVVGLRGDPLLTLTLSSVGVASSVATWLSLRLDRALWTVEAYPLVLLLLTTSATPLTPQPSTITVMNLLAVCLAGLVARPAIGAATLVVHAAGEVWGFLVTPEPLPQWALNSHAIIGGLVIFFASLNAAVVIFKIRPVVLGLLVGGFFLAMLIMLLYGPQTLLGFFRGFRHLGVKIEPMGFLLLAYIWSIFLRIIWLRSLFFYWVFLPNRLELQHGLSESNDAVDREELRLQIDTDDVILRWWNVGIITFYFPNLVVLGIRKKAEYANRIASVKTMQD